MARHKRQGLVLAVVAVIAGVLIAGGGIAFGGGTVSFGKPGWWRDLEQQSNVIAETQVPSVPYPQAQMKFSLERSNLRERLLRFNRPEKIGYVYLVSFGKFVGYYVIKGKVSSVQSQMTNTHQTWSCGDSCEAVADSIGDDGSFGENEGGDRGFFFFLVNGTLVETTADFVYSDQPMNVDVPNLGKRK